MAKRKSRALATSPATAFAGALSDGDLRKLDPILGASLAETELVRQSLVNAITERGVLIENRIGIDRAGNAITTTQANPALSHLAKFSEQLGHTASDTLLTRKSQGQTARDLADAAADAARHDRFMEWKRDPANGARLAAMAPPRAKPQVIDVTPEPGATEGR